MNKEGYDVSIAVKFTSYKSIIKFFRLNDAYPFSVNQGLTLEEFVQYFTIEDVKR